MEVSHSPPHSTCPPSIPLFDLRSPSPSLASSLVHAAHEYGFLYLRNPPGLSASSIETMFRLSSQFFHSPTSLKSQYNMQLNNRGWTAPRSETLDPQHQAGGDPKEAFNFGGFDAAGRADQPLPPLFQENEADIRAFANACKDICLRVLDLIAEGLGIEDSGPSGSAAGPIGRQLFASSHDPAYGESGTILRLLHYPASRASSDVLVRAGAHSDYGSLTLLFRQPGDTGLEIQPPRSVAATATATATEKATQPLLPQWLPVPVHPPGTETDAVPPVLVNIGDLLSYWTGGWLRSTVHRVVFSQAGASSAGTSVTQPRGRTDSTHPSPSASSERQSLAYFCHPQRSTPLAPLHSKLIAAHMRAQTDAGGSGSGIGSGSGAHDAHNANGANGTVLTATQHLQGRLAATYGWQTEPEPARTGSTD